MRKFLSYLKGRRGIALISYMWLILMAYVIVYVDVSSVEMKRRFYIVSVAEVILLALICVCPRLLEWAENLSLHPEDENLTQTGRRSFFLKVWFVSFCAFLLMYAVFFPGAMNYDCLSQYAQALGMSNYNDWHPVLHTLLVYSLPLKLTGGWFYSIHIFQIILFSLILAYMALTLSEYAGRKYAKNAVLYILLNPATLVNAIHPMKDTSFSMVALLLMTLAVRIYFTRGGWLKGIKHSVIFILLLIPGSLFRHNGILFTLPLLFAVSFWAGRKRALIMLLCFFGLIYAVKYPLYPTIDVEAPGRRQVETLGATMSIIGSAVKEAPEQLDNDVLEFAYSIPPKEVWEKAYQPRNGFDSIKIPIHYMKAVTLARKK